MDGETAPARRCNVPNTGLVLHVVTTYSQVQTLTRKTLYVIVMHHLIM